MMTMTRILMIEMQYGIPSSYPLSIRYGITNSINYDIVIHIIYTLTNFNVFKLLVCYDIITTMRILHI